MLTQSGAGVGVFLGLFEVCFGAVDGLVVGVGVALEAFNLHDEYAGGGGGADGFDDALGGLVGGGWVGAVDAFDGDAAEVGGLGAVGEGVEGVAGGGGGEGEAVVFDEEEQGEVFAGGFAYGFVEIALLGGAVADGSENDGGGWVVFEGVGDAGGLQDVGTDKGGGTHDVELAVGGEGGHAAAGGVGVGAAEEAVEDGLIGDAAGIGEGAVAVVKVEPVVGLKVGGKEGAGFVSGGGDVEEDFAALGGVGLKLIGIA